MAQQKKKIYIFKSSSNVKNKGEEIFYDQKNLVVLHVLHEAFFVVNKLKIWKKTADCDKVALRTSQRGQEWGAVEETGRRVRWESEIVSPKQNSARNEVQTKMKGYF